MPSIYQKKLRRDVITKYGGKCECCGIDELAFLTLHHKNNDGAADRKALAAKLGWNLSDKYHNGRSGTNKAFYVRARRDPIREDLGVLCWNCNCAEHYSGICPHRVADST